MSDVKPYLISADSHIDFCWLPTDLFVSNASSALKSRMPRVVATANGNEWQTHTGVSLGRVGGLGHLGRKYVKGDSPRADELANTGLFSDGDKGLLRPSVPELRQRDLDLDGVDAEIIYGVLALASNIQDADVFEEVLRIYNTWVASFCKFAPNRFFGVACIPLTSVDAAVREVHRAAQLGLCGGELPARSPIYPLWDSCWEPLWKAFSDTNLTICVHTVPDKSLFEVKSSGINPKDFHRKKLAVTLSTFQLQTANFISTIIFSGALDRYRNLRVAVAESGVGWLPYLMERMDGLWEEQFGKEILASAPSEYFQNRIFASFQSEPKGLQLIAKVAPNAVMFASDYPHPDGVWPRSKKVLETEFVGIEREIFDAITYGNATKAFDLKKRLVGLAAA